MEFEFWLKNRVTWEFSGGESGEGWNLESGKSAELFGDLESRSWIVKKISMFEMVREFALLNT